MTSDGISDADWSRVHDLALAVLNTLGQDETRARASLLAWLDRLDGKYGVKPSLLATRADYIESSEDRESLFRRAYQEAERIGDEPNQCLVAHSLAEFYIEARRFDDGARWLGTWRQHLGVSPAEWDQTELARLEVLLLKNDCP